jgi:hypothetical protein
VEKDEIDAIQQLASMLPKGEHIMDSTGKVHKVGGNKPVSLEEQIKETYSREQKARSEGDQEAARKHMREHMRLTAEVEAQAKKQSGKKITPEEYNRMLQQDLIRLPDGRVARRHEIRSPYET